VIRIALAGTAVFMAATFALAHWGKDWGPPVYEVSSLTLEADAACHTRQCTAERAACIDVPHGQTYSTTSYLKWSLQAGRGAHWCDVDAAADFVCLLAHAESGTYHKARQRCTLHIEWR
jgi:hypothetical protein